MLCKHLPRSCLAGAMVLTATSTIAAAAVGDPQQPARPPLTSTLAGSDPAPLAPIAGAARAGGGSSAPSALPDLPRMQPGLWEYRRTQVAGGGTPKTNTFRKCSDPNAEFEQKLAELRKRGCVFTPFKQHGNRYEASWRCDLGDGRMLAMHDSITIIGPTSYKDDNQAVIAHDTTESSTVAVRLRDCPADPSASGSSPSSAPAPLHPQPSAPAGATTPGPTRSR
jgi:hypothetical protein